MRIFIIVMILLSTIQCRNTKNSVRPFKNRFYHDCSFIEIEEPFSMKILFYFPAPRIGCGSHHTTISVCVGVMDTNDTIRVLTLCNTDTTFRENQKVVVTPYEKPYIDATAPIFFDDEGNNYTPYGRLNTIFGSLLTIKND